MGVTIEATARPDAVLASAIGRRRVLLVLDNFEHVLGAAPGVGALLEQCPNLTVLATSRAPVGLRAEQDFQVPPLAVPVGDDEAGRSYRRRRAVRRAGPQRSGRLQLDDDNRAAVFELCRRLEGIPLALELAAARVRMFEPSELVARLDERLDILGVRAGRAGTAANAECDDRVELRPPATGRACALRSLECVRGGFHPRPGRAGLWCGHRRARRVCPGWSSTHSSPRWPSTPPSRDSGMFNMIRALARDQLDKGGDARDDRRPPSRALCRPGRTKGQRACRAPSSTRGCPHPSRVGEPAIGVATCHRYRRRTSGRGSGPLRFRLHVGARSTARAGAAHRRDACKRPLRSMTATGGVCCSAVRWLRTPPATTRSAASISPNSTPARRRRGRLPSTRASSAGPEPGQ